MVDNPDGVDATADTVIADIPEDWPDEVKTAYAAFFSHDTKLLVSRDRLGDLAFSEVAPVISQIRETLSDLTVESWLDLPSSLSGGGLLEQLEQLNQLAVEIQSFDLNQADPAGAKTNLLARLTELADWIKTNVRPFAIKGPARRAAEQVAGLGDEIGDAAALRTELAQVRRDKDAIVRDLESHKDLIGSLRDVSGESASSELSQVFMNRATELNEAAKRWLKTLVGAGVAALIGAVVTFLVLTPDGEADASDVGRLTLSVFILGLLIYAVRVCGQQYRANRHLEAVARSKAAALSTFTRFSGAVEEESVRSTLALTLAQAVFATEETGFIDASNDRVTLVDHALPRIRENWDGIGS